MIMYIITIIIGWCHNIINNSMCLFDGLSFCHCVCCMQTHLAINANHFNLEKHAFNQKYMQKWQERKKESFDKANFN